MLHLRLVVIHVTHDILHSQDADFLSFLVFGSEDVESVPLTLIPSPKPINQGLPQWQSLVSASRPAKATALKARPLGAWIEH